MMKQIIFPIFLLLLSCSDNQSNDLNDAISIEKDNQIEPICLSDDINPNFNTKSDPTIGSTKALLIGKWVDKNDETVVVEITSSKYYTYNDGTRNWNQEWDLSTELDISVGTIDDNGTYIHVYSNGEIFYTQKIIEITEWHLTVLEIELNGQEKNRKFSRI